MKEVIARLKEHQSPTPSRWREEAEWRLKNRSWLRHSQLCCEDAGEDG